MQLRTATPVTTLTNYIHLTKAPIIRLDGSHFHPSKGRDSPRSDLAAYLDAALIPSSHFHTVPSLVPHLMRHLHIAM